MKHMLNPALRAALFAGVALAAATLPASAASVDLLGPGGTWFSSSSGFAGAPSGNGTVSGGTLTYRPTNQNGEMLSYFAPAGAPITLAVGEQITLSFTYSIAGTALATTNGLRIGLFDSNDATRVSSTGFASAAANDYTGYFITTAPSGTSTDRTRLYARNDSDSGFLIGGSGTDFPTIGDSGGYLKATAGYGLTTGQSYSGSLSIARLDADTVSITYTFLDTATSVVYTDSVYNYTSFDTVGINVGKVSSDGTTTLTFTSLDYEITAIPEPASVALLLGGVAALLATARLRKQR